MDKDKSKIEGKNQIENTHEVNNISSNTVLADSSKKFKFEDYCREVTDEEIREGYWMNKYFF